MRQAEKHRNWKEEQAGYTEMVREGAHERGRTESCTTHAPSCKRMQLGMQFDWGVIHPNHPTPPKPPSSPSRSCHWWPQTPPGCRAAREQGRHMFSLNLMLSQCLVNLVSHLIKWVEAPSQQQGAHRCWATPDGPAPPLYVFWLQMGASTHTVQM